MERPLKTARALAAGLLALAGLVVLAGCGDSPAASDPITTPPTATPPPSPTPSPTPTGPVRAADDPTWTPEQLAAAQTVDRYYDTATRMSADLANANFGELLDVTTDPYYSQEVQSLLGLIAKGASWVGDSPYVIAVSRTVSPVATVDGRQEIHVVQCQVDNPGGDFVINGSPVDTGTPQEVYDFTVQWVDASQGWKIAEVTKVSDGC